MDVLDKAIIGHQQQQQDLLHALRTSRLGHAYIFSGEEGTGKSRVARALAKALVCETPIDSAPCLACRQCRMVEDGVHPDVRSFERDKSTYSVELMREDILPWAARTAREGKVKVGILIDVEHLGRASANAFLKTLEEPPSGTHWILISGRSGSVLTTIASRCRELRFGSLNQYELEELLEGVLKDRLQAILEEREETKLDPDEARFALEAAEGSPGRFLRIVRERIYHAYNLIEEGRSNLLNPFDASEELHKLLSSPSDLTQEPFRERINLLIALLQRESLARKSQQPRDEVAAQFDAISDSLNANANVKLVLDNLALTACRPNNT